MRQYFSGGCDVRMKGGVQAETGNGAFPHKKGPPEVPGVLMTHSFTGRSGDYIIPPIPPYPPPPGMGGMGASSFGFSAIMHWVVSMRADTLDAF